MYTLIISIIGVFLIMVLANNCNKNINLETLENEKLGYYLGLSAEVIQSFDSKIKHFKMLAKKYGWDRSELINHYYGGKYQSIVLFEQKILKSNKYKNKGMVKY